MAKSKQQKLLTLLKDLKTEYLKTFPEKIAQLKLHTEKKDWKKIQDDYHRLKGMGKTYGYPEISIIGEKLEQLAENKETQKISLFQDAIQLLEDMHQSYLKKGKFDLSKHPIAKTLLRFGQNL